MTSIEAELVGGPADGKRIEVSRDAAIICIPMNLSPLTQSEYRMAAYRIRTLGGRLFDYSPKESD